MTVDEPLAITAVSNSGSLPYLCKCEFLQISLEKLFQRIIKTEGLMGLYRGMGANMLKVIPAVSISYACYEKARAMLGI